MSSSIGRRRVSREVSEVDLVYESTVVQAPATGGRFDVTQCKEYKVAQAALQTLVHTPQAIKSLTRFGISVPDPNAFQSWVQEQLFALSGNQFIVDLAKISSVPFPSTLLSQEEAAAALKKWARSLEDEISPYLSARICALAGLSWKDLSAYLATHHAFPANVDLSSLLSQMASALSMLDAFRKGLKTKSESGLSFFCRLGTAFSRLGCNLKWCPKFNTKFLSLENPIDYLSSFADSIYYDGVAKVLSLLPTSEALIESLKEIEAIRGNSGANAAIERAFDVAECILLPPSGGFLFYADHGQDFPRDITYFPEDFVRKFHLDQYTGSSLVHHRHLCCCRDLPGTCVHRRKILWDWSPSCPPPSPRATDVPGSSWEDLVESVCQKMGSFSIFEKMTPLIEKPRTEESFSRIDIFKAGLFALQQNAVGEEILSRVIEKLTLCDFMKSLDNESYEGYERPAKRAKT